MDINERVVLQLARERLEEAVRAAEERRAIGTTRVGRPVRARLGTILVTLGHWMMGPGATGAAVRTASREGPAR